VAQAGFAWPQVPAFHKVSGVWVVSGFWLRWRVGIRTLPTRLTRHSSGRGLCFVVLRLASSAAPLNWVVRRKRARPMGCFGIVGKIDVSPLGR